jgi:hypothetical protein
MLDRGFHGVDPLKERKIRITDIPLGMKLVLEELDPIGPIGAAWPVHRVNAAAP